MFGKLGETLKKATDKLASAIFIDKKLIESIVKDLQRALIEADVNIYLVKQISEQIRAEAEKNLKGVEKKEHLIKLLHDKILEIIGGEKQELEIKKPERIMLLGLYGSGKTTTIAKLSNYYNKRGFNTAILGLDVHRPAASEQLEQLGKQNNLKVFTDKSEKNPIKIYEKFKKELEKFDIVFIDTAGRHSLDKELITEIKNLNKKIKPTKILLIIASDIGQTAKTQASDFKESLDISGVIITRMDSTAKGGGALTACYETQAKVLFITHGEKINDLESFNPEAFVSRILGMGDLESLMEKVNSTIDKKSQEKLQKNLQQGKFTLQDFYEQLEQMQNIGPLGKLAELIPSFGKAKIPENLLGTQEEKMKKWKFAIQSMTNEEKENPEILEKQTTRLQRIAKGSGNTTSDIRSLIKQYKILKEFAKSGENLDLSNPEGLSQKQLMKLAKKFKGKIKL